MTAPRKWTIPSLRSSRWRWLDGLQYLQVLVSSCNCRCQYRWAERLLHLCTSFLDHDFPPGEQIPRHMDVIMRAAPGPFGEVVRMTVNGVRWAPH